MIKYSLKEFQKLIHQKEKSINFDNALLIMSDISTLYDQITNCKFCDKKQPKVNLFCINCHNRDWC